MRYKIYVIPTSQLPNYFLSIPDLDLIPNIEGIFSLFFLFFVTELASQRNTRVKLSRVTTTFLLVVKKKKHLCQKPSPIPQDVKLPVVTNPSTHYPAIIITPSPSPAKARN